MTDDHEAFPDLDCIVKALAEIELTQDDDSITRIHGYENALDIVVDFIVSEAGLARVEWVPGETAVFAKAVRTCRGAVVKLLVQHLGCTRDHHLSRWRGGRALTGVVREVAGCRAAPEAAVGLGALSIQVVVLVPT